MPPTTKGLLWCALLLFLCAAAVHAVKLIFLGIRSLRRREEPERAEKRTESVYYIVEKKKRRSKAEYGEPKKIEFR